MSTSVADGLAARASSNAIRTMAMRPRARASGVMALSPLSNTGMMTASLIASQVSIRPAKPPTMSRIRCALQAFDLVEVEAEQPGRLHRVPDQRMPLDRDAPLGEPTGGPGQALDVGAPRRGS